jgi:HSP20 family molecular chaperone IbpA
VVVECPGLNGGGKFRRVFALSMEVIEKKVDAKFVEGMLRITLPKAEKVVPKRIETRV